MYLLIQNYSPEKMCCHYAAYVLIGFRPDKNLVPGLLEKNILSEEIEKMIDQLIHTSAVTSHMHDLKFHYSQMSMCMHAPHC